MSSIIKINLFHQCCPLLLLPILTQMGSESQFTDDLESPMHWDKPLEAMERVMKCTQNKSYKINYNAVPILAMKQA